MKADHKKPAVAFAVLAVLAAAIVGGQVRADARDADAVATPAAGSSASPSPSSSGERETDRASRAGTRRSHAETGADRPGRRDRDERERKADRSADRRAQHPGLVPSAPR